MMSSVTVQSSAFLQQLVSQGNSYAVDYIYKTPDAYKHVKHFREHQYHDTKLDSRYRNSNQE